MSNRDSAYKSIHLSRDKILAAIKNNKPAATALPDITVFPPATQDLVAAFTEAIHKAGGEVIRIQNISEIPATINQALPGMYRIADFVNGTVASNQHLLQDPEQLEVVVLRGRLGVAENGAIWLQESDCVNRVVPFITQHLALVLHANTLVNNMHEAYALPQLVTDGYGVFIAGPSKTADIEQSLVIGAHGAKSLLVFLETDNL